MASLQLDQLKLNVSEEPMRLPQALLEVCAALSVKNEPIKQLVSCMQGLCLKLALWERNKFVMKTFNLKYFICEEGKCFEWFCSHLDRVIQRCAWCGFWRQRDPRPPWWRGKRRRWFPGTFTFWSCCETSSFNFFVSDQKGGWEASESVPQGSFSLNDNNNILKLS